MLMWNGTPVHSPTPDQRSKIEDNDLKKKIKTTRFRTLTLTIAFASATVWGQTAMPKKIHQEAFSIVGIEARTSNAQEMKGEGVIPKQWQKFFQDGVQQKIANRTDPNLYALYTDYASDRDGEYSFVIGVKVDAGAPVPPGMVLKKIPGGDYAVITSEKGPVAKVVVAAWQKVWALEDKAQLGAPRTYKADFEIYDSRSTDPQNSQVDLYIGLK
jgi:predicted transcriptional regulator YdeE